MKKYLFTYLIISIIITYFSACSVSSNTVSYRSLNDKKYESEFIDLNVSEALNKVAKSIKLINSQVFYKSIVFSEEMKIKKQNLTDSLLKNSFVKILNKEETSSGTSIIIANQNNKVLFLTCAHVIDFPDTIITYYSDPLGFYSDNINQVSIKLKQSIYVPEVPGIGEVDLILEDKNSDIALLGKEILTKQLSSVPVLEFPIGNSLELDWGNYLYLMGYPFNTKMLTRGVVSSPRKDEYGGFMVDAVINHGFSGGVILAVSNGLPNFEFVGMVQAMNSEEFNFLAPRYSADSIKYNSKVPYKGEMYAESKNLIRYGFTRSVPINLIIKYVKDNFTKITSLGYNLDQFLNPKRQ